MIDQPQTEDNQPGAHACAVDRLYDRGRRLRHNAQELEGTLRDTVTEIRSVVREQFEHHPYMVFGAGFATGYVMGGGLPSRLTRFLVSLGMRVAIGRVTQELISNTVSGNGHAAAPAGRHVNRATMARTTEDWT